MKKYILALTLIIVLGGGIYAAHHYLWLFTPAYSEHQTLQQFLSDVSHNKLTSAYSLTSQTFQSKNSLTTFRQDFSLIDNDQFSVNYKQYTVSQNKISIVAIVHDNTANDYVLIGANVLKSNKNTLDSVIASLQT